MGGTAQGKSREAQRTPPPGLAAHPSFSLKPLLYKFLTAWTWVPGRWALLQIGPGPPPGATRWAKKCNRAANGFFSRFFFFVGDGGADFFPWGALLPSPPTKPMFFLGWPSPARGKRKNYGCPHPIHPITGRFDRLKIPATEMAGRNYTTSRAPRTRQGARFFPPLTRCFPPPWGNRGPVLPPNRVLPALGVGGGNPTTTGRTPRRRFFPRSRSKSPLLLPPSWLGPSRELPSPTIPPIANASPLPCPLPPHLGTARVAKSFFPPQRENSRINYSPLPSSFRQTQWGVIFGPGRGHIAVGKRGNAHIPHIHKKNIPNRRDRLPGAHLLMPPQQFGAQKPALRIAGPRSL